MYQLSGKDREELLSESAEGFFGLRDTAAEKWVAERLPANAALEMLSGVEDPSARRAVYDDVVARERAAFIAKFGSPFDDEGGCDSLPRVAPAQTDAKPSYALVK